MAGRRLFFGLIVLCITGSISPVWAYTENTAEYLTADVRKQDGYRGTALIRVSEDELAQKVADRREKKITFVLVDLRLEADYGTGHIPGAVNIPLKKLRWVSEQMLAKADDIIFYGYSRDDAAAVNAVIFLINKGFQHVSLVDGGIAEWKGDKE